MTRFTRWLRKRLEKWQGRYYEGPEPPKRLGEMATLFAQMSLLATRAEWVAFARELAAESYRAGWQRGYENAERDPDEPSPSPEQIADLLEPSWRDREYTWTLDVDDDVDAPGAQVQDEVNEVDKIAQALEDYEREGRSRL